jgi:hypothetical protein
MKTRRIFVVLVMLTLVLFVGLSTISCATAEGVPFSAEAENQDISAFVNSRDFVAKNYAGAFRAAAKEGYTKVLHVELVKLGPFGIFGTNIRITAIKQE